MVPAQVPQQLTCGGAPVAVTGTCTCVDGRQPTVTCGTANSLTCEFLCGIGCNPTTQDCVSPTKSRCQVVADGTALKPECVAPGASNLGEQQVCTPSADNCIPGTICSNTGNLHNTPRCERYCTANNQCPSGGQCLRISTSAPAYGVCNPWPTCTPFSTSCGAGNTCGSVAKLVNQAKTALCRTAGTAAAGAACTTSFDCGANLTCASTTASGISTVCTPLCDSTPSHPCAGTLTCTPFGIPAQPTFGYCK